MTNPLAMERKPAPRREAHPLVMHAQIYHHVNQMPADQMQQQTDMAAHVTPVLGALAADPNVTRKQVIKAAADAAGSGKVAPDAAVKFISQMPDDPDALRPWLKQMYAANMAALVHLKAAAMPPPEGMPQQ